MSEKGIDFAKVEQSRVQARRNRAETIGNGLIKAVRTVFRGMRAVAEAFAEAKHQQALYRELSRMTDRELRDIGVNRADIPAVVSGRLTRDTGRPKPAVAAEAARPAQTDERLAA